MSRITNFGRVVRAIFPHLSLERMLTTNRLLAVAPYKTRRGTPRYRNGLHERNWIEQAQAHRDLRVRFATALHALQ